MSKLDMCLADTPTNQVFMDHLIHMFAHPNCARIFNDGRGHVMVACDDGEVEFAFDLRAVHFLDGEDF